MTKARYMALADFQTLWTDKIKPSLPTKDEYDTLAARVAVTVLGEKAVFAADYNVSVSGTKVIFG